MNLNYKKGGHMLSYVTPTPKPKEAVVRDKGKLGRGI